MPTITIGFSRHHTFAIGSNAIQAVMKRPFSHTYFKYKDPKFTDHTIFHAVGKGLIYISETQFLICNLPVAEFNLEVSDALFDELLLDCHNNAGKEYGFFQNLGILLVRLLAKINIHLNKNPIDDGINCSEWMFYLLEEIYGKWTQTDPNLIAPDEVFDFLNKLDKNTQL